MLVSWALIAGDYLRVLKQLFYGCNHVVACVLCRLHFYTAAQADLHKGCTYSADMAPQDPVFTREAPARTACKLSLLVLCHADTCMLAGDV